MQHTFRKSRLALASLLALSGNALWAAPPQYDVGAGEVVDIRKDVWTETIDGTQYRGVLFAENGGKITVEGSTVDLTLESLNKNADEKSGRFGLRAEADGRILIGAEAPLKHFGLDVTTKAIEGGANQIANGIVATSKGKGQSGGHIDIRAETVDIRVSSPDYFAYGIYSVNLSEPSDGLQDAQKASVRIDAEHTVIDVAAPAGQSNGIIAWSEGRVDIEGSLDLRTWNGDRTVLGVGNALNVRGGAVVNINASGDENAVVRLDGTILFEYDGESSGTVVDADVRLNLTNPESYWNGGLVCEFSGMKPDADKEDLLKVSGMSLGLSNGAQWTPAPQENAEGGDGETISGAHSIALNKLEMSGGVINVTDKDVDVRIEEMTGPGGTVNLAADLAAEAEARTGRLTVESAAPDAALDVNLMNADLSADLTADELTPEVAKELLGNVAGAEAQVTTDVREGLTTPGFGIDGEGTVHVAEANSLMVSTLELASAAPLALNRILTNDLRKRMGDLRTDANAHGAWARYDGGRLSGGAGLKNDFHTVQVGVDTVPVPGATRVGLAFSYTESDAEYARGDADMTAFGLSAYGTWMNASGFFADVVARIASADTDLNVDGKHKGAMDNTALSLSAEVGQRWDLARGLFLEPQAEVAFTYVDDERFEVGPASYAIDSVESLTGRIGLAAGWTCPEDFGNVYARVSVVHEFLGDAEIRGANGGAAGTYGIDGKDTWVEYGIGANLNLSKSAYLWADLERTGGAVLDEDWRATVGVRYGW